MAIDVAEEADQQPAKNATPKITRRAGDRRMEKARKKSLMLAREPPGPRQPLDSGAVDAAREEGVGLARVAREEPLQVAGRQILGVVRRGTDGRARTFDAGP